MSSITGCYVLDSDPSSYMEYIDNIGDWVSGQCPQDMVYRDDYCMCTLQSKLCYCTSCKNGIDQCNYNL